MFFKQKGILPNILFFIGLLVHIIFIVGTVPILVSELIDYYPSDSFLSSTVNLITYFLVWVVIIWLLPLLIGSLCVSAFPEIRVTEKGIEYRTYKIFRSIILWTEIIQIINLSRGYKAIGIKRKGFNLFNGLYSNQLYGYAVNIEYPILLLSPKLENIEEILKEIESRINDLKH